MRLGFLFIVLFLLFSCGESDSKIESAGMETYIKSKILKDVEYVRWIEPINDYSGSAPEYNFNSVPFELMFDKNRPAIYPVNEFLGLLDFTDYDKDIFKTAESFNKSVLNGSIDYALVNGMYSDLFHAASDLILKEKLTGFDTGVPVSLPNSLFQVDSVFKTAEGEAVILSLFISKEDYKAVDITIEKQESR